jgi:hypothetical protein
MALGEFIWYRHFIISSFKSFAIFRWLLIGSLFITAVTIITLINDYVTIFSNDDSILTDNQYRTAWGLMVISSLFYTIGSFAFLRAVHNPPMKPLFRWYHFSTDELFASWMFVLGTIPAVPYSLIFLSVDNNHLYLGTAVSLNAWFELLKIWRHFTRRLLIFCWSNRVVWCFVTNCDDLTILRFR